IATGHEIAAIRRISQRVGETEMSLVLPKPECAGFTSPHGFLAGSPSKLTRIEGKREAKLVKNQSLSRYLPEAIPVPNVHQGGRQFTVGEKAYATFIKP